jgi:tetratricopeptide (TPR) repeat protein
LINLANVRFKLRHYRRAMQTYLQAEKLANATKNRELQATLLTNISWLYTVMGAYPDAMTAIERAIGMLPAAARSSYLARMLAQKATLHSRMGEISKAEEVLGRAFREADRSGDVRAQIGMLEKKKGAIPGMAVELHSIEKALTLAEAQYDELSKQQVAARLSKASNPEWNITILSPASPAYRKKTRDYVRMALGPLFSLVVALGFAFFIDNLDHSIKNVAEAEETLGYQVLASFPDSER